MQIDEEKVELLRDITGKDYGFCERALIRKKNNYDKALNYILYYDERYFVRLYKHIVSICFGEKSYRFRINNMDETIIDIPLIIPVLLCLIFSIPSIFIAFLIVLIMITNSSINLDVVSSKESISFYRKRVKQKRKNTKPSYNQSTYTKQPKITKDEEGFSIIDIM